MKKILPIIIIILVIIFIFTIKNNNAVINKNYYIALIGGTGEQIYKTYLYWDESKQNASYICTTSTTKSWGNSKWNERITKKGNIEFVQEIYEIAKNNNSFSYVIVNKDILMESKQIDYKKGDKLTIDELYKLFNEIGTK